MRPPGGRARVVLLDPDERQRTMLAGRLRAQLFQVDCFSDPAEAADYALSTPPQAVIADVWMAGVSGVQLCRLLRLEPATEHVSVILRAEGDEPKARFWAEQAGAAAYVPRGRVGDLVRALNRAISECPTAACDGFFTSMTTNLVRDRIAEHLDQALFESVIASSVRALGTCESFPHLFDLFSQFVCRVTSYRWLAVLAKEPQRLAVHCHGDDTGSSVAEAATALDGAQAELVLIEDEDASEASSEAKLVQCDIHFGSELVGRLAMKPLEGDEDAVTIVSLMAREIGGPLKIAKLVEESKHLARRDPLTGIMNRRAFVESLTQVVVSALESDTPLGFLLLDVDFFKAINDSQGHNGGDWVLRQLGLLIRRVLPRSAIVARWGGEEFVVALPGLALEEATEQAEGLRGKVQAHFKEGEGHEYDVQVTVSLGVAVVEPGESLESLVERADRAMYAAKVSGRNRVVRAGDESQQVEAASRRPGPTSPASADVA